MADNASYVDYTHLHRQTIPSTQGVTDAGVDIELTLRGWQPVEIDLRGIDPAPADGAAVRALARRLPDWVNLTAYATRVAHVKI